MYRFIILITVLLTAAVNADSARSLVEQGNQLYADQQFDSAIEKYTRASEDAHNGPVPDFNKANSLYRLENFQEAIDNYKKAAAESSDKNVIAAAKYNLGNSFFQKALQNQQAEPEKTLDDMKTSIGYFRDVLDIDPANPNAAQNIEVAKTVYKQIKEQQQQDQQQQQEGDEQDKDKQDQSQQDSQDPQQQDKQDQSQQQGDQKDQQDQQQQQEQQEGQEQQPMEQQMAPDATAQQILDKEKQRKKERQILQSSGFQKVEKDW